MLKTFTNLYKYWMHTIKVLRVPSRMSTGPGGRDPACQPDPTNRVRGGRSFYRCDFPNLERDYDHNNHHRTTSVGCLT
jgi:hypothetical protein